MTPVFATAPVLRQVVGGNVSQEVDPSVVGDADGQGWERKLVWKMRDSWAPTSVPFTTCPRALKALKAPKAHGSGFPALNLLEAGRVLLVE